VYNALVDSRGFAIAIRRLRIYFGRSAKPKHERAKLMSVIVPGVDATPTAFSLRSAEPALSRGALGARKEVAFVDTSVENWQALAADIAAARAGIETVLIGAARNGLVQMAEWAVAHAGYDAIHLLAHGSEGSLTLGAATLTRSDLRAADVRTALAAIGRALAPEGDLLVYACRLAQGDEGAQFLAELAEATSAHVAGSTTLTGAAELGGDWILDAQIGAVRTASLASASFPGVLVAPTIGAPGPVVYMEDGSAASVGDGVSFTGGSGYGGGSLRFEVSDPNGGDVLKLISASDPNAAGAISVDPDGTVYLGNGTGRDLIGTVDATEDGLNGQALKINFTGPIVNPSFESGVSGWTIGENRVILGTTVINGHVTPDDLTDPPNSGDDAGSVNSMTYDSEWSSAESSDGTSSLRLHNSGQTTSGFDVVHGPYAYSNTFAAKTGDVLLFDWKAAAGGDAYDAFGYLMNADTGEYQIVLNETGADDSGVTNWATANVTVPEDGNWFFVFVAGTYDFTGGRAVGGSLYVDNFRVVNSAVTDAVVSAITAQVTYESTTDEALPSRTLTIDVTDGDGNSANASTTLDVTNVNDAPTGAVAVAGTATQGSVLTASNTIVDVDGPDPLTITYRWQRQDGEGNWVDIDDATGETYTLTENDVGHAVRAVAQYTDAGSTTEQVASNETTAVGNLNDAPTGAVALAGTATQGQVLTASNTIADLDGVGTITYRWQRQDGDGNWVDIDGATGETYTLTQDDVGAPVRAVASYTDGHDTLEEVASDPTTAVGNVNDVPTGAVALAGTATQGQVLTASNTIADLDGVGTITYRWQRQDGDGNWVDIDGATGETYTLTQDDVGAPVRAVASYTDGDGTAEEVASDPTTAVGNFNDDPTGAVAVAGTATQGQVLTASNTIADLDGPDLLTITYRWQRQDGDGNWVDIDGATGETYTLTQDDVGAPVRAVASYTDGHDTLEEVISDPTTAVGNVNDVPTGAVAVAGTATQGSVLTASNTIADLDGVGTITYRWQRQDADGNWVDIDGATGETYTLTQDDVGAPVRAVACYTDGHDTLEEVTSDPTTAVGNVNDDPTGAVAVAGTATQGQVLTASNTIADLDGVGTITYRWQRQDADGNWVDIDGATGETYTLTQDDVGHEVHAVAQYTDGHGTAEQVASNPTMAVGNVNDDPTGAVAVNGTVRVGQTLTASNTIVDPDGVGTITYQWQRQDGDGNWVDIDGATGGTYTLTPDDLGSEVRAAASYTDLHGAAESVLSSPTGAVQLPAYYVTTTNTNTDSQIEVSAYDGPVSYLVYEFAGTSNGEAVLGTAWNDFVHLGEGDDAIDGGAGDDVLDGGTGSSFLTGGAGQDVFYVDGRGGETIWSTITDWQAGEQLALWGWDPGVSQATWVDDDGVEGYKGVTMHADINNDGTIDTSVTWAGLSRADLPTPIQQDGLLWFA
jgi:hypothetical protein